MMNAIECARDKFLEGPGSLANGDGEVDITEFDITESDVTFFQEIDITESDVTKKGN